MYKVTLIDDYGSVYEGAPSWNIKAWWLVLKKTKRTAGQQGGLQRGSEQWEGWEMRTRDGCILDLQLMRRVWGSFQELDLIGVGERL